MYTTNQPFLTEAILAAEPLASPTAGVELHQITYDSQGYRVKALLAIPTSDGTAEAESGGVNARPLPALLYCRGGYRGVGKVRPERIAQLASFGYVVIAPHYRGNEGGEGQDKFGGDDRHDVYSAYELLRAMPMVQPDRISLFGFSRGGMMALLAAIERPGFHSAVVWSGVTDMFLTYEERNDLRRMLKRLVGHPEKDPQAYLDRSPIFRVSEVTCPILIIHGTEDENVGPAHAKRLAAECSKHGKPYDFWLVDGASHLFDSTQIEEYTRKMFAWLGGEKGK
ncbi:prolyl oligopeptidase family serine peptidase [Brevibacillus dissolubilis]|uniref:alpha/beta hydrolase family protein n=1 Tax=Brevibacillus dissolubilis TaxID=1844116 RepID=UPI0011162BB6